MLNWLEGEVGDLTLSKEERDKKPQLVLVQNGNDISSSPIPENLFGLTTLFEATHSAIQEVEIYNGSLTSIPVPKADQFGADIIDDFINYLSAQVTTKKPHEIKLILHSTGPRGYLD